MNAIDCNIVLLPSAELAQKTTALSRQLQTPETFFCLDPEQGPFPHISLYLTKLQVEDLDAVSQKISVIAKNLKPFTLQARGYVQMSGYIDVDYDRTEALVALQKQVLAAINPIRKGLMRKKDEARLAHATGIERENLETYGYRSIGEQFRPHITLTRFADNTVIDTTSLPDVPSATHDQGVALGLFEMGENGTIVRKIATFPL